TAAGAPVALGSIAPNTLVKIQFAATDPTTATTIKVVVPESENQHDASGSFVSADTVNNTITLQGEHSATPTTYKVDPAATITLDHVATTLDKIPVGADVE